MKETAYDAVMERVDAQGNVLGFSILGVTRFRKDKPLEAELLGAASATLVAYVLAVAVFDFDYCFNPWLVPIGLFVGGISVALVGVLATRSSLRDPPIATLRKA